MAIVRDAAKNVLDLVRGRAPENGQDHRVPSPTLMQTLESQSPIFSIAFLPDNEHIVSGDLDGTVSKWRVTDGREVGKPMNHGSTVDEVAVSADGGVIASGGGDGKVVFWNCGTCGKLVGSQGKHEPSIRSLSFGPDSQTLTSTSTDGSIMVWSVLTGGRVAGSLDDQPVRSAAFSPSPAGDKMAGSDGWSVRVWDGSLEGEVIPAIVPVKTYISSLVWSPDGHQLICGNHKGKIHFFDSSNGDHLATCRSRTGPVFRLHFRSLLSLPYFDSTVRLWSTSTHQQLASLKHPQAITTVSISHNGRYLASGRFESEVYIWRFPDFGPAVQENKQDSAASITDKSDLQPTPVNSGDTDETASVKHATLAQDPEHDDDEPQGSGSAQGNDMTRRASGDSWLDMPAVLAAPAQTVPVHNDDAMFSQFFGDDYVSAPTRQWRCPSRKMAKSSRQYLFNQLKHFRNGVLPREDPSDTNSAPRPSTSRKLRDRISHIRRRSSLMPENAQPRDPSECDDHQPMAKSKGRRLRSSFVAYSRLRKTLAVASNDPPVQQQKLYITNGKLLPRPDPSDQATLQQKGPQIASSSSSSPSTTPPQTQSPSSSTTPATSMQAHAQSPAPGDSDVEVGGCCCFLISARRL